MKTTRLYGALFLIISVFVFSGCSELNDCRLQNDRQLKLINELRAKERANELELDQLKRKLAAAEGSSSIEVDSLRQQVEALEKDLADKKAMIASMQQQLLFGGSLPVELSTMLEDFAKANPSMITYDAERGMVKFKSDLLFEPGSDVVAAPAKANVKALCDILNTEVGKDFDVIIAGHTDDMRIAKAETKAKHPTNWHLSAHRGISVLRIMETDGIDPVRMSIRGFSEYRPVEANKPNKGGNEQNRRVEIFIVPKGV